MRLCEYVYMRTTIDVPDVLFRRVKAKAAFEGVTIKEIVERALTRELNPSAAHKKGHRVKLPLIKGAPGHAIRPLSRGELDELMFG